MSDNITIYKNDVIKAIYFIVRKAQGQNGHAMFGTLSSKGDLMGGIFDRWINVIPESIIFNKLLLNSISNRKVEVISDFYEYDPASVGIAPDVIGIKVDDIVIPFVEFDERWKPISLMPQIEVKTFKENQKMISLRNQGYNEKFLVMVESNFRVDYLLPFFDKNIFNDTIFNEMKMDNSHFIKSNMSGFLQEPKRIDIDFDDLGTLSLLSVTKSEKFMEIATFCEERVSVIRVDTILEASRITKANLTTPLEEFCEKNGFGLYRFKQNWYDGVNENDIPYFRKSSKNSVRDYYARYLDFECSDVSAITVIKKNKDSIFIDVNADCTFNLVKLNKGKKYKIEYKILDRESNTGTEYFFQKELIEFVPDYKKTLSDILKNIVENAG